MKSVSRNLLLALVPITALGLCRSARADVMESNPGNPSQGYQFGLFFDPNTGARYGTIVDEVNSTGFVTPGSNSYDPFFNLNTSVRSAYGISATLSNGTSVSGYADPQAAGVHNIVATQFSSVLTGGGTSAQVRTFLNAGGPNLVQIDQSFSFAPNHPNIVIDRVTLTNLPGSGGPISSLNFRSITDFTILDSGLNLNAVVHVPGFGGSITSATGFPQTSGGFPPANADPLMQPTFPQTQTGTFFPDNTVNNLPDPPNGAGINLDLGGLGAAGTPNDSTSFNLFYATAAFPGQSLAALESEVSALGGNYQISGFNLDPDDSGNPANFDLVIVAVQTVPEPATIAVFGIGLAGLAGWRRWRRATK